MFNFSNKKKFGFSFLVFFLPVFLISIALINFTKLPALALQAQVDESILIDESSDDNLYLAGSDVKVEASLEKDVAIIGENIELLSRVRRNVFLSGFDVNINTNVIGGSVMAFGENVEVRANTIDQSVRVLGNKVVVSGNIAEDLIIAGNNVVIEDANIRGDVYVHAGTLTIKETETRGDLIGGYDELRAEGIEEETRGEYKLKQNKDRDSGIPEIFRALRAARAAFIAWSLFSSVIGLGILVFILKRYNKLEIEKNTFTDNFLKDLLTGLSVVAGIIFISIFGVVVLPLTFQVVVLFLTLNSLINLYFFIYLANLLKNSFNIELNIVSLIVILFFGVSLLALVPIVNGLIAIFSFVIGLANLGFVSRKFYEVGIKTLRKDSELDQKVVTEKTKKEDVKNNQEKESKENKEIKKKSKSKTKGKTKEKSTTKKNKSAKTEISKDKVKKGEVKKSSTDEK